MSNEKTHLTVGTNPFQLSSNPFNTSTSNVILGLSRNWGGQRPSLVWVRYGPGRRN